MKLTEHIVRQHPIVRRALAVLLALLTLAGARIAVIMPVQALVLSQAHWRAQARRELAAAKGAASTESTLRAQLDVLPRAPVWKRFYPQTEAQSPDAALRADLTTLTSTAGVTLQSLAPLPTDQQGTLRRYGMRIAASMTIDQLERLVIALRHQSRYLRVEQLAIQAPIAQTPQTNPALLVHLAVYGYAISSQGGSG